MLPSFLRFSFLSFQFSVAFFLSFQFAVGYWSAGLSLGVADSSSASYSIQNVTPLDHVLESRSLHCPSPSLPLFLSLQGPASTKSLCGEGISSMQGERREKDRERALAGEREGERER